MPGPGDDEHRYDRHYRHRSVATAIREGITTPDQLAYWDDQGEIVDGCYIPSGSPIYADDGKCRRSSTPATLHRSKPLDHMSMAATGATEPNRMGHGLRTAKGVDVDGDIVQG